MALRPGRTGWRHPARPTVALPEAPETRSTPFIAAVRQHPDRHPRTTTADPGFTMSRFWAQAADPHNRI